ncbi:MAG: hypothetical protein M3Y54_15065 [Bacteroidota bacterium]|nr:hypothetical protein [Bacteroidota bacterium]
MLTDLTPAQRQLADYLGHLSGRCWQGAGWIMNLEYVAWHALTDGPRRFGYASITAEDIATLRQLANAANAWIYWNPTTRETAVPLAQWPAHFSAELGSNRELLDG